MGGGRPKRRPMLHVALAAALAITPGYPDEPPPPTPPPAKPGEAGHAHEHAAAAPSAPLDWRALEAPLLSHHVQLTTRDRFVKAGEAYFSPDAKWIIFQAIPVPEAGKEAEPFYSM